MNSNVPRNSNLAPELHGNYLFKFKLVLSSVRSNSHMMAPRCANRLQQSLTKTQEKVRETKKFSKSVDFLNTQYSNEATLKNLVQYIKLEYNCTKKPN